MEEARTWLSGLSARVLHRRSPARIRPTPRSPTPRTMDNDASTSSKITSTFTKQPTTKSSIAIQPKQCQNLRRSQILKGITDLKLESAVSVVLGDTKLLNDFQACQQYLSTTVENRATLEKSKERNISGISKSEGGGSKKEKKLPKNFKLENKWYPPSIF